MSDIDPPRKDSFVKALGRAKYTDDLEIGDFLYGRSVGVPIARGILNGIKFDTDFDWTGFVICTAEDVKKERLLSPKPSDEPILIEREINYYGQPAVLLAHHDPKKLQEAIRHISFEFEELPPVYDIKDGPSQNKFSQRTLTIGDTPKALTESDHVIEGTYSTQAQEHLYLETQIVPTSPTPDF